MIMVVARILFVERRLGPFPYLVIGCEGVESRRLSGWPLASEAARSLEATCENASLVKTLLNL